MQVSPPKVDQPVAAKCKLNFYFYAIGLVNKTRTPVRQKTMKKIIALGALSLGVLLLAGCGQKQASQTQPTTPAPVAQQPVAKNKTADWKNYANNKFGFELKYPADWKYDGDPNEGSPSDNNLLGFSLINPSYKETDTSYPPFTISVSLHTNKSIEFYKQENKKLGLSPSQEKIVAGEKTLVDYNIKAGLTEINATQYRIIHNGNEYLIKITDDYRPIGDQIISSLKFTK